MGRLSKTTMVIAAAALVLAGCGPDEDEPDEQRAPQAPVEGCATAPPATDPNVGLAYDVGGRGDLSFNDAAYAGVSKAVDELDATFKEAEAGAGENDADREERLRLLADAGFNPILAIGFVYSPAVGKVAAEYPDVDFAVVDGYVSFLDDDKVPVRTPPTSTSPPTRAPSSIGAAAALKTKTGTVGFLGGVNGPLIQAFEAGFKAGVQGGRPEGQDPHRVPLAGRPGQGFREPW